MKSELMTVFMRALHVINYHQILQISLIDCVKLQLVCVIS